MTDVSLMALTNMLLAAGVLYIAGQPSTAQRDLGITTYISSVDNVELFLSVFRSKTMDYVRPRVRRLCIDGFQVLGYVADMYA